MSGETALAAIDRVLRDRPHASGEALSDATRALADWRDGLLARTPRPAAVLAEVNAGLSVILAVHFPLGDVPWAELDQTRARLAAVACNGAA